MGTTPSDNGVERTTRQFLDSLAKSGGKPMETLTPGAARDVLTTAQASVTVKLPETTVAEKMISLAGQQIPLIIVRPPGTSGMLPAFLFFHGGGWVLGDFPTHERLVRDLVTHSGLAAVFVDYSRSPQARFPIAINQAYAATNWVAQHGSEIQVDGSRLAIVGNSVGGNMTAVIALMAKQKGQPALRCQVLFWPVTDANFDTQSYQQFRDGYFLTRGMMRWFWDHYLPDKELRSDILASPLRATTEDLMGLPPALVQTAEFDVLRDEGEAYAGKLNAAGVDVVSVRMNGMIHDYGLLNALSQVPAVQAALRQAADFLRHHLI